MTGKIKENNFEPGTGGTSGTVNYQAPIGIHASPEVSQNPDSFETKNKPNTLSDKAMGSAGNTAKDVPPSPMDMGKAVDQIYSKKQVPTADQVKAGLDYELHNMIKPDKHMAKERVLSNLRRDPKYYGELYHMNVDDEHMKVDLNETKKTGFNFEETKKIVDDMIKARASNRSINSKITSAMRQSVINKKLRNT